MALSGREVRAFDSRGGILLRGRCFAFDAEMLSPDILNESPVALRLEGVATARASLAGMTGSIRTDSCRVAGLTIMRQVFASDAGDLTGVRMSVTNNRPVSFRLRVLRPLVMREADALTVGGSGVSDWEVVRQSRQKNDIPGCFRPAVADPDFADAATTSAGVKAGMGMDVTPGEDDASPPLMVDSEPCIYIQNRNDRRKPGLLVGVLGQSEHLSGIVLTVSSDRQQLSEFGVVCEFDGILVEPGTTRTSHWTVLLEAESAFRALDRFSEMIVAESPAPRVSRRRPTVYCSWYYYGREFDQDDLDENLAELSRDPLPMDVILVDGGWMDTFGAYNANERFPRGMAHVAERIRHAGFEPGIWTCPFVVMSHSPVVKQHPELLCRDIDGKLSTFWYDECTCNVVDPTSPYAPEFFRELYGRLRGWGFTVHKLDFLRSILVRNYITFHDPHVNRAQAYQIGMRLVRQSLGDDAYIIACGGLFEGTVGYADCNRLGSDSKGRWGDGQLMRIKQTVFRNYTARYWHTDPDALMLRRRSEELLGVKEISFLTRGEFTDEEAFTTVVQQYLAGGIVCISEKLKEFPEDRRALLRHIIPPVGPPAQMLDPGNPLCPTLFLTRVTPECPSLDAWHTLCVGNWEDTSVDREVEIPELCLDGTSGQLALFEFRTQRFLGIRKPGETIRLMIPAHGMRVIRMTAWDGKTAVLLGTDLHLSGGGCEIEEFTASDDSVVGRIATPWKCPVTLTVAFPEEGSASVGSVRLRSGDREFAVRREDLWQCRTGGGHSAAPLREIPKEDER